MLSGGRPPFAANVRCASAPPRSAYPIAHRAQNGESRPLHVLRQSLAAEGPRFLLRGWTPAFVRLGPNTVLMFVFFEVRVASRALSLSARC
jgi:hypothetical protein